MMNKKLSLGLAVVALLVAMLACSFGGASTATPTTVPPPPPSPTTQATAIPATVPSTTEGVDILSTNSFVDQYGYFDLVGEVANNTNTTISSVELEIQLVDASGNTLLKDENGNPIPSDQTYPFLDVIGPGESSPFVYSFDTSQGVPATYNVKVVSEQTISSDRASLATNNVQIVSDNSGTYYLSGELVNQGDQWAHINNLAGGVLNDANDVLSAGQTGTYASELAPTGDASSRDRTPFVVDFPDPGGNVSQWSMWWDAEVDSSAMDYPVAVNLTNGYFDDFGDFHVVGTLTNNSDQPLNTIAVAGLYGADGTVLDADYAFSPYPLPVGVAVPFDISYFGNVNYNQTQANLVDSYTVQVDEWNTYPPSYDNVNLSSTNETIEKDSAQWTVNGTFVNSSTSNVDGATVLVAVYDAQNNLVATGRSYFTPNGNYFAPNDTGSYSVTVYFDPNADLSGYSTETTVVGDVYK
jgi:hypothetical protein